MRAELQQIEGQGERWRFAVECTGVAMTMPGKGDRALSMVNGATSSLASRPGLAALVGMLSLAPFAILNGIVANRIEPFFAMIRPGVHTSAREYVLLVIVLLLIPAGAIGSLLPVIRKGDGGRRRFHFMNLATGATLLAVFALLSIGLGSDIYACEVLQAPNCD
jgi:hypothetical protein